MERSAIRKGQTIHCFAKMDWQIKNEAGQACSLPLSVGKVLFWGRGGRGIEPLKH
jgi:hypothetical protein